MVVKLLYFVGMSIPILSEQTLKKWPFVKKYTKCSNVRKNCKTLLVKYGKVLNNFENKFQDYSKISKEHVMRNNIQYCKVIR